MDSNYTKKRKIELHDDKEDSKRTCGKKSNAASTSPPWQVLELVVDHLDPKTIAIASCVSKLWRDSFSSDHHWKHLCLTNYPSLSKLHHLLSTPYRHVYAMGYKESERRSPSKLHISLNKLEFLLHIRSKNNDQIIASVFIRGEDLKEGNGLFQFNIDVGSTATTEVMLEGFEVSWHVMLKGWRGVFCMIESKGKLSGANEWFSQQQLPSPVSFANQVASGLAADVKIGFCTAGPPESLETSMKMEKVTLSIMATESWRYVTIDDGLRYLQHFLAPSFSDV